ncbi:MAG: NAD-dependent succinate-semialdehyde dehydrogenase [Desulfatiglans sp.]|jgi:succinate-semialdehyde dehydrogenase/glutarate-semialdehyde dehydrogenase|nr:NAD-dependent succinate-semialdehyde dehydrogenase [Thermodesulfobacteriota bacterium]MEE4351309.1 NAD-dependent succinate-semialdehyde dehydrogenase [Desulfatiglans sp.]
MYINGEWVDAVNGDSFESLNPATGETIGRIPAGDRSDALKAIDAAAAAFPNWSSQTAYQRSRFLYQAYSIMMEELERLATVMTEEQGKPIQAARNEVKYGADFLLWYAEESKRIYGQTIPSARKDQRFIVLRQPVGVVGAVTPWNYPISMITRKVAPALAAGCTIVLKPAEATPFCAKAVFEVFEKAGIPSGVANLVTALEPEPIGEVFLEDPRIRKLTFTGSTQVGKMLARGAASQLKRVSLELGGHAPFIVCRDADPIHAAKGLSLVKFLNTGQACISPNRIFVHRDMLAPFIGELSTRVSVMKAGSGFEIGNRIGPLVNVAALEKVDRQVRDAVAKGADLVAGGRRLTENGLEKGFFYAPTILNNVTADMTIYREETFGPVAPIIPYDKEDDLLTMANDTNYGLASYVYTRDLKKAFALFEGLHFGIVGINDINPTSAGAPFGGMKESGLGREGAIEGIDEYLETKLGGFSV